MKKLTFTFILLVFITRLFAQNAPGKNPIKSSYFSGKEALEDIEQLDNLLKSYHSGLFWYMNEAEWENKLDLIKNNLSDQVSEMDLYKMLNPLIAKIACGHTAMRPSHRFYEAYNKEGKVLPFSFKFLDGGVFINQNFSKSQKIPQGTEITAIDGESIEHLIGKLLPQITSDGNIKSAKINELEYWFPMFYSRFISNSAIHTVTILENGKEIDLTVESINPQLVKTHEKSSSPIQFSIEQKNNSSIGLLKIKSFNEWDLKEADIDYDKFLKNVFASIKKENLKELIIDLRRNNGGNDDYGAKLFSYLTSQEFEYYESIEVKPETKFAIPLASRISYKFKESENGKVLYTNHAALGKLKPQSNAFEGDIYVLINGGTFSAAAGFAALLSDRGRAIMIGEETGGAQIGNTSGVTLDAILPNTGIRIAIPTFRYKLSLNRSLGKGYGVIPDHRVSTTFQNWISNHDSQMEYAYSLINRTKLAQASR